MPALPDLLNQLTTPSTERHPEMTAHHASTRNWPPSGVTGRMTQPALSRLEAGGVIATIPLLDPIFIALDANLIVEIAPHTA
jgi:hypothetical protein